MEEGLKGKQGGLRLALENGAPWLELTSSSGTRKEEGKRKSHQNGRAHLGGWVEYAPGQSLLASLH